MNAIDCIMTRRSVRGYTDRPLDEDTIKTLLQAAISAPSGRNGQPWKFKVVTDKELINKISDLSRHGAWMRTAACLVAVYLDKSRSYDRIKDAQSCGAAIQNMMLAAHSLGIGSCWIGEILPKDDEIKAVLNIENSDLELMAVVTLGYGAGQPSSYIRNSLESFLL